MMGSIFRRNKNKDEQRNARRDDMRLVWILFIHYFPLIPSILYSQIAQGIFLDPFDFVPFLTWKDPEE